MSALAIQRPAPAERPARPFLKWAGGKTQLLTHILGTFPGRYNRYFEPFLGGGAVFFGLRPDKPYISDVNENLINAYTMIRDDVDGVIKSLKKYRSTEANFYKVRAMQASRMSSVNAAARMIFLNRTCFNGLYRVNRKGEFNVPFGRYKDPKICDSDNLNRVSNLLQHTDIKLCSAFESAERARRGDLVYFDPPYEPLTSSASFTAYTSGGFGRDEQARLANLFGRLAKRGVHVVLSNSDTPFINDLYKDFNIQYVSARRAINSRASKRGPVSEVIVTSR